MKDAPDIRGIYEGVGMFGGGAGEAGSEEKGGKGKGSHELPVKRVN